MDNKIAEHNSEILVTCILTSISAETRAKLHAVYDDFKIGGMVYCNLVFKGPMNKDIVNNKQKTRYLPDNYSNLPLYMITCDSGITKFILD